MESFCHTLASLLQDKASEEQNLQEKEYNVFLIGYQQSGKSTLANILSDQQQLHFEKDGNQFIPVNDHHFPITKENGIGTQQPNSIQKSEYQIWDFPGYGMEEDSIENRILQILIMNKAPALHIIIVLPYTQFTQDRGQNLIQLLNLISQKDLPASIIVSKVPPKAKLETIRNKLQSQLNQEEVIYGDEAKDLLNQIIKDNRIQIFNYPQMIEGVQQFKDDNIKQIQQLVFDKKYFHKVKIQFRFLSNQQLKIKEFASEVQQKLSEINQSIMSITIKLNISRILRNISDQQLDQQEQEYKQLLQQKHKYLSYNNQFQQISDINQNDDKIELQINKINDFFVQQDVKLMQNKLYICCASYSINQLKEIYDQNKNIKEIYIQSLHQFIVDCDIRMPGVHLYIRCKQFKVILKSNINLKGENAQHPPPKARSGDETNIHGDIGCDGKLGQPGGIFYVEAYEYFCIENITIDISGGDGGNGQDGGDGYDGKNGEDGRKEDVKKRLKECEIKVEEIYDPGFTLLEKVHCYYESKGTPGTIGGNSGCGGQGGQSGVKGVVKFHNFQLEKANIIDNNSKVGLNGKDGIPGKGGQDGIDYIGLYQEVKSIVPEISKAVIKNMSALQIGLSVVMPFYAVGYFGTLGLANAASLVHAKVVDGWIFKKRCDDQINMAPSGIIKQELFQEQQQNSSNYDANLFQGQLEIFIKMQEQKLKEIRNQFQELQFPDEIIQLVIGETQV